MFQSRVFYNQHNSVYTYFKNRKVEIQNMPMGNI